MPEGLRPELEPELEPEPEPSEGLPVPGPVEIGLTVAIAETELAGAGLTLPPGPGLTVTVETVVVAETPVAVTKAVGVGLTLLFELPEVVALGVDIELVVAAEIVVVAVVSGVSEELAVVIGVTVSDCESVVSVDPAVDVPVVPPIEGVTDGGLTPEEIEPGALAEAWVPAAWVVIKSGRVITRDVKKTTKRGTITKLSTRRTR